jgi:hypothetical protein
MHFNSGNWIEKVGKNMRGKMDTVHRLTADKREIKDFLRLPLATSFIRIPLADMA